MVVTSIYNDLQKVAADLIGEFRQGDEETFEYVGLSAGTGGTPDNPAPLNETVTPFNSVARGAQFKYVDGANIFASDMQLTMPANLDVIPSLDGFIQVDGRRYKIVGVNAVPPAGVPVVYRIFYRR